MPARPRAGPGRNDELRPLRAEVRDGRDGGVSFEDQAAGIEEVFRRQLTGLRRRFRPWEIPAVLRALQEQRSLSLRLLRERQAWAQGSEREERRRQMQPPPPRPP